jgi:hypothetical protein
LAESFLHHQMKESVSRELTGEGYSVFEEPPYAPSRFLSWVSYRPDLFGMRASSERQEYVLVECETRPSSRRLAAKNFKSMDVQTRLNSELSVRRILVVPRGTLARVDPSVRLAWETWIYGTEGFQMFPRACEGQSPARVPERTLTAR